MTEVLSDVHGCWDGEGVMPGGLLEDVGVSTFGLYEHVCLICD